MGRVQPRWRHGGAGFERLYSAAGRLGTSWIRGAHSAHREARRDPRLRTRERSPSRPGERRPGGGTMCASRAHWAPGVGHLRDTPRFHACERRGTAPPNRRPKSAPGRVVPRGRFAPAVPLGSGHARRFTAASARSPRGRDPGAWPSRAALPRSLRARTRGSDRRELPRVHRRPLPVWVILCSSSEPRVSRTGAEHREQHAPSATSRMGAALPPTLNSQSLACASSQDPSSGRRRDDRRC